MSRSGYSDDCDTWPLICWRGAVASALRGRRGQQFLIELRDALDAISASSPRSCRIPAAATARWASSAPSVAWI